MAKKVLKKPYGGIRDAAENRKMRLDTIRKMLKATHIDEFPMKRFVAQICLETGIKRRRAVEYLRHFEDAELISMNSHANKIKVEFRDYL